MTQLSWEQVNHWGLRQHHLLERAAPQHWLDVVRRLNGLHAQVMSAAELQVWARVQNFESERLQNALWKERTLVKTWAMRGTLHLLAANDYPAFITALNNSVSAFYRKPSWLKYHGVTLPELNAIVDGVYAVLTDVGITREKLADAIAERIEQPKLSELMRSGWGALLKPAAHAGHICFGPNQGQNVTFVRPDRWLGAWEDVDADRALQDVVRRFLTTFGPATVDEFGRWWGIDPAKAKKLFRALSDEVVEVDVEGWKAWALVSSLDELKTLNGAHKVNLLPLFDPYTLAVARHSDYLLSPQHKARVYRPQGWISAVVLVDGRIVGVWDYEQRKQVAVTVELFESPTRTVKQDIEAEAQQLGRFFKAEVRLQLTR